ncbi:hypothetical protein QAD02_003766 [Eretmocerus hayati]|uniref:Uncharacterized protein n=1 Tax=Eretmocerus hayati TaxID=131215 RepID=A0ACC2NQI3_9HYME|nr:hypothetical protein QAD02_003766 [Eretmocerus hayati]
MMKCKKEWLAVDNSQAVLIQLMNKWNTDGDPLYRIGFRCWLLIPQCETDTEWKAAIAAHIKDETEVKIMWPVDCNVKSAKETLKVLTCAKSQPVKFEATVVKILAYGEISLMKTKLINKANLGTTTPKKEDRKVTARKNKMQDENVKASQRQPKKQVGKAKSVPSKRSEEDKQVKLEKLSAAKAARRALVEVKGNAEATKRVQLSDNEPGTDKDAAADSSATDNSSNDDVRDMEASSKNEFEGKNYDSDDEIVLPQMTSVPKSQTNLMKGNRKLASVRKRILLPFDDEDAMVADPPAELIDKVGDDDADLLLDSEQSEHSKKPEELDGGEKATCSANIDNGSEQQIQISPVDVHQLPHMGPIHDTSQPADGGVEQTVPIRKEPTIPERTANDISDADAAATTPSVSTACESRATNSQDQNSGSIPENQARPVSDLSREELLKLLQKKDEELKARDQLVTFWKSKCSKMQEYAKRFATKFDEGMTRYLRPMYMDTDEEPNQSCERSSSSLDSSDEAVQPSDVSIHVSGTGGKKRRRDRSDKVLPLAKKRRTTFPLPTTWKLSEKIESICSNRHLKTVRKVANLAIPELFTQEELRNCCPMGNKRNRCWTRFSKDPNWYEDFKAAMKYQMKIARAAAVEEA